MEKLLTKAEVAELLGVSVRSVDRLRESGALKWFRVRGRVRPADVRVFMSSGLSRRQAPDEIMLSAEDLVNGFEVDVDCGSAPADARVPLGQWYCGNSDCEVREVTSSEELM